MEAILRNAFNAAYLDYTTRVSDSVLARLHFVVRVASGQGIPDVDERDLQQRLIDATRTWDEDLAEVALSDYGEEGAARLVGLYGKAFPEAYKEDFSARDAIADLRHIEALDGEDALRLNLYHAPGTSSAGRRLRVRGRGPLPLASVVPLCSHFGLVVVDERPYQIHASDGGGVHVYN